jgi:hypothetical protein
MVDKFFFFEFLRTPTIYRLMADAKADEPLVMLRRPVNIAVTIYKTKRAHGSTTYATSHVQVRVQFVLLQQIYGIIQSDRYDGGDVPLDADLHELSLQYKDYLDDLVLCLYIFRQHCLAEGRPLKFERVHDALQSILSPQYDDLDADLSCDAIYEYMRSLCSVELAGYVEWMRGASGTMELLASAVNLHWRPVLVNSMATLFACVDRCQFSADDVCRALGSVVSELQRMQTARKEEEEEGVVEFDILQRNLKAMLPDELSAAFVDDIASVPDVFMRFITDDRRTALMCADKVTRKKAALGMDSLRKYVLCLEAAITQEHKPTVVLGAWVALLKKRREAGDVEYADDTHLLKMIHKRMSQWSVRKHVSALMECVETLDRLAQWDPDRYGKEFEDEWKLVVDTRDSINRETLVRAFNARYDERR